VKVLLRDSRVDINLADNDGRSPLWWASYYGYAEVIEWMIASGRGINLDKKGKSPSGNWKYYIAIEIATEDNKTEVVSLLERFTKNQAQTRHEVCLELGLVDKDAAEVFALTVFICDGFLRIKEPAASSTATATDIRFFNIAMKLPMELQMVLCHRVFRSGKDNIKSRDSEPAFRSLAKVFMSSP
jgi:hypothetical protein